MEPLLKSLRITLRLLVVFVAIFLAAELVLRLTELARYGTIIHRAQVQTFEKGIGYKSIPGLSATLTDLAGKRNYNVTYDPWGTRIAQGENRPVLDTNFNIYFLGDSITASEYLPIEETFCEIIYRRLHAKRKDLVCFNGAVGGTGTQEQIDILKKFGMGTKPDLVVLFYYLNDIRPGVGFGEYLIPKALWFPTYKFCMTHSSAFNAIMNSSWSLRLFYKEDFNNFNWVETYQAKAWLTNEVASLKMIDEARNDWGSSFRPEARPVIESDLRMLKNFLDSKGVKLAVVIFPVRMQIESKFVEDTPQKVVSEILNGMQVPYLDLLPVLRGKATGELYLDHCHFTSKGQALVADLVMPFMTALTPQGPERSEKP